LTWSPFYRISNQIGGNIKLPSKTLYDPLPVVIVDIRFGGSPALFWHTLQIGGSGGIGIYHAQDFGCYYRTLVTCEKER
jgi:hypothetical protein